MFICLLTTTLYSQASKAQNTLDTQSEALTAGPGVERRWSDLINAVRVPKQNVERPILHEIDAKVLQDQKKQPFVSIDNLPFTKADQVEPSSGGSPLSALSILRNFEGLDNLNQPDGYLHRPPDPILAVGLNYVGVMVNSEVAFYTKDGVLVNETDFSSWWSNVYSGTEVPFDPRIAYDHHANRWLMVALIMDASPPESWYLLSASQTSDPTDPWWNYKLEGKLVYSGIYNTWADYPDLGFDGIADGAVYITSNQFSPFTGSSFTFRTAVLNIIPKSALYSGASFNYWRAYDGRNGDGSQAFTLRAAHIFGNPGVEYLINSQSGTNYVTLWRVTPTFPPSPVDWVRQATITVGSYSVPPDAQQLGGTAFLDTIDNRIYNAMYRNGYLFAAFTESYNWGSGTVAAIRYLKINTTLNSADLNVRYGADGYYYWFPAIYADSSDNIVLVFARSSATEYAGIYYTGQKPNDAAPQPSAPLKAGETYITGTRWGDYFGIGNDPSDGSKMWIYGEWAKDCAGVDSVWDWGTWIGEVVVTIQGDINGDRKVSVPDLFGLGKAYGSVIGNPNWNPNADINKDNNVNNDDLLILTQNYGKIDP